MYIKYAETVLCLHCIVTYVYELCRCRQAQAQKVGLLSSNVSVQLISSRSFIRKILLQKIPVFPHHRNSLAQRKWIFKEAQAAPFPFPIGGIIATHDYPSARPFHLPPPFSWGGRIFYFEDFLLVNDEICKYSGRRLPTTGLISSESLILLATYECLSQILQTKHARLP